MRPRRRGGQSTGVFSIIRTTPPMTITAPIALGRVKRGCNLEPPVVIDQDGHRHLAGNDEGEHGRNADPLRDDDAGQDVARSEQAAEPEPPRDRGQSGEAWPCQTHHEADGEAGQGTDGEGGEPPPAWDAGTAAPVGR